MDWLISNHWPYGIFYFSYQVLSSVYGLRLPLVSDLSLPEIDWPICSSRFDLSFNKTILFIHISSIISAPVPRPSSSIYIYSLSLSILPLLSHVHLFILSIFLHLTQSLLLWWWWWFIEISLTDRWFVCIYILRNIETIFYVWRERKYKKKETHRTRRQTPNTDNIKAV